MPPRLPRVQSAPRSSISSSPSSIRSFSQTCPNQLRRLPRWKRSKTSTLEMKDYMLWVNTEGIKYKQATEQPNYLEQTRRRDDAKEADSSGAAAEGEADSKAGVRKDRKDKKDGPRSTYTPFPQNPYFKSQAVLSEALKEEIYNAVAVQGRTLRNTSTTFKVSMERVAAVVRMKQMERDWLDEGKKVVPYFSEKILKMLPQTQYSPGENSRNRHESINDLPVHASTTQQIFWPTSESREFTRIDAGKVFKQGLLPSDMRIPHPQLVDAQAASMKTSRSAAMERMRADLEKKLNTEAIEKAKTQDRGQLTVQGKRFDFRIENVNVDWAGKDGRSRKGVGYRYGMPHEDRKRGLIKVPTSVS